MTAPVGALLVEVTTCVAALLTLSALLNPSVYEAVTVRALFIVALVTVYVFPVASVVVPVFQVYVMVPKPSTSARVLLTVRVSPSFGAVVLMVTAPVGKSLTFETVRVAGLLTASALPVLSVYCAVTVIDLFTSACWVV